MLRNEQIVYIANDWFNENKTSAHHIAEVLSRDNEILYVEAAGMRAPRASGRDFRKILTKVRKLFSRPVKQGERFYLYSPFVLPYHRYRVVRAINRVLIRLMLGRALATVRFKKPLVWIFMPHYASALDAIPRKGVVYYVVDEHSEQPKVDREMIQMMEREILRRADVVFGVSEALVSSKQKFNNNTYLSPHGVDRELFKQASEPETPVPDDIASIRRPIAGFFGLMEEWVDMQLAAYLAGKMPDVSFVWIGRVAQDIGHLEKYDNVHFLGRKPYIDLPKYLKVFDVCLLPYNLDSMAPYGNPKKLREYLAGGKPVVSVDVQEVKHYPEFVYVARDYEEFATNIRRALTEDSAELQRARIERMQVESWEARVERICTLVSKHIEVNIDEPIESLG